MPLQTMVILSHRLRKTKIIISFLRIEYSSIVSLVGDADKILRCIKAMFTQDGDVFVMITMLPRYMYLRDVKVRLNYSS